MLPAAAAAVAVAAVVVVVVVVGGGVVACSIVRGSADAFPRVIAADPADCDVVPGIARPICAPLAVGRGILSHSRQP